MTATCCSARTARRGQRDRRRERLPVRPVFHPQQREVRPVFVFDVEDLDDRKFELLGAAGFFEEVDRRRHRLRAASLLEREAAARPPAELAGDVAIGHDRVLLHEPAGADVREVRQAGHVDAADGPRRALQMIARRLQPGAPDRAVAVLEFELRRVADDRQHRPARRAARYCGPRAEATRAAPRRRVPSDRDVRRRQPSRAANGADLVGQRPIGRGECRDEGLQPARRDLSWTTGPLTETAAAGRR